MNDEKGDNAEKKAELLVELDRLHSEIRRRLLALVEHPGVSDEFKINPVVKEWVK